MRTTLITNAVVWDAENYEQINPQITDNSGVFAWDVPNGWWQVRFEKDGYEAAQTEWMQVAAEDGIESSHEINGKSSGFVGRSVSGLYRSNL